MNLTPEQKHAVAEWIGAGDNLSAVQKKLLEKFQITMTYRDVRFLVDDLDLTLKDPAPKADASDVGRAPPAPPPPGAPQPQAGRPADKAQGRKGFFDKAKERLGLGRSGPDDDAGAGAAEEPQDEAAYGDEPAPYEDAAGALGGVSVTVDKVTLIPGAMASGTVTFSDGVTGKWIVDNYGRPGFTEISKPGYRPSAADAQAFMQELSQSLQRRGI